MKKVLKPQTITSILRPDLQFRAFSGQTTHSNTPVNTPWKESYKDIVRQLVTISNQFDALNKQVDKLSKDSSVHDELIKQNSRQVDQAIKKEVLYVVKDQDYVTNGSMKQQFSSHEKIIDEKFSAQEKLFDSKISGMEARLINEFHKSKQDTIRWTAAIGAAGLTLGFGIFQHYENKRIEKNEEQILRSLPQAKQ